MNGYDIRSFQKRGPPLACLGYRASGVLFGITERLTSHQVTYDASRLQILLALCNTPRFYLGCKWSVLCTYGLFLGKTHDLTNPFVKGYDMGP